MQVTVLICTHDRAALLARVLDSLNAAQRPAGGACLLVAANGCRDDTHELLQRYAAEPAGRLPLRWIDVPTPGKSHALNAALPLVDTPLVAFVDDDHRVDAGYLTALCAAADRQLPVPRFDQGDEGRELDAEGRAIPGGGNLFLRTDWAARIGNFATDMGPRGHDLGGAEDLDWVLRGLRMGARLRYVPEVVQYHYVDAARLTLPYLIEKAYKRTASTLALHPGRHAAGVPPYLWRKLAGYALRAVLSPTTARRRFYCVRTAAALGEVAGHRAARRRGQAAQPGEA